jgi:phosphoribosylformylglycinamidine synthase
MKVAIIQFPGSNCERETALALKRAGLESEAILWNVNAEKLKEFAAYILIGGFSYEDRVRSGLIASMDPLMAILKEEAKTGKAILGICNGAQILVESGLVPGLANNEVAIALTHNKRILNNKLVGTGFYNAWINIKASHVNLENAFSSEALANVPMHIPAAHGEGRFMLSEALYAALKKTAAVFYYYCDDEGNIRSEFPVNPNGAAFNLAGISNAQGNILALMPHPERTPSGDPLFLALKTYLIRWEKNGKRPLTTSTNLNYQVPKLSFKPYEVTEQALHFWVGLNIHDNEALSLESSLQAQGLALSLKRYTHWQIEGQKASNLSELASKISASDFIFNRKKEYLLTLPQITAQGKKIFIIQPLEDEVALHKQDLLQHELKLPEIKKVTREIVWVINAEDAAMPKILAALERKPIFGNPLSHVGFELINQHQE